jgi:hypothetical protein
VAEESTTDMMERVDVDGAVERWRRCVREGRRVWKERRWIAEEEDATSAGTSVAFGEVGGVAVNMEDHGAGVIA